MIKTILKDNNIIECMVKACKNFLRQYNEGEVMLKSGGRDVLYRKNKDGNWVMIDP